MEGMIQLKLQRPRKTEEAFLTFRMRMRREEMDHKAVCSVCLWHLTLQSSHLITLDVDVINLGEILCLKTYPTKFQCPALTVTYCFEESLPVNSDEIGSS